MTNCLARECPFFKLSDYVAQGSDADIVIVKGETTMKPKDQVLWRLKTAKLNANRELKRGDVVRDSFGSHGIVVKIREPEDVDDHGTIYVWQDERQQYGADNCEHYSFIGWQQELRIQED